MPSRQVEMGNRMYHVVVVGAGPAGSAAAKRCAERGFKTLLLEKKKLPRDKICSGMVMGPLTKNIIAQEFGEIPHEVLVAPHYLSGFLLIAPGVDPQRIDNEMPLAWRKDLDYWMNLKAKEKGVEIWDGAKVTAASERAGECTVVVERDGGKQDLKARFVIGADGAASAIRKSLFPKLEVEYTQVSTRECYEGELNIDKKYYHWFLYKGVVAPRFSAHHKGNNLLLQVSLKVGQKLTEIRDEARQFLAEGYGFDLKSKPLWRDGCLAGAELGDELLSGSFLPAKGNILLVGDAAGLQLPPMGEGIGAALKTGLLAANSISNAVELKKAASEVYFQELAGFLAALRPLDSLTKQAKAESAKGLRAFLKGLRIAWDESLKIT